MKTTASRYVLAATLAVASPAVSAVTPMVRACIDHTIALASDGTVYEWGSFNPDFTIDFDFGNPVASIGGFFHGGVNDVRAVACGFASSYLLRADGSVSAYGYDVSGQLALAGGAAFTLVPTQIAGLPQIQTLSIGTGPRPFVLALDQSGRVWGWGDNSAAQLVSPATDRVAPTILDVPTTSPIVAVAAGLRHSVVLDAAGDVWVGGREVGAAASHPRFEKVNGLPRIVNIAANYSSFAIASDGSAWAWGDNSLGELGIGLDGAPGCPSFHATPTRIPGLANVRAIAAGSAHTFAVLNDGSLLGWGENLTGELGSESLDFFFTCGAVPWFIVTRALGIAHPTPTRIPVPGPIVQLAAGAQDSFAIIQGGALFGWGWNKNGRIGDGTFADRSKPQPVLSVDGRGVLDLTPEDPVTLPAELRPVFAVVASGTKRSSTSDPFTARADINYRPEDVGSVASTYVFAVAPTTIVASTSKADAKDSPACVLAQLEASGQLRAVNASNLQALTSGVLSSQAQAVTVLNSIPPGNVAGATFYVGYGSSSGSMLSNGTNRSVLTVPNFSTFVCTPQAPQTGWWWNPAEGGRGYSIETRGNHIFFAAFHYDVSGRSTWNVASGSTSIDGSLFQGDLQAVSGGQTLGGPYRGFPSVSTIGSITLAFSDAMHGTMVWPGGAVPIQRFAFAPAGLTTLAQSNQPESGWWWNPNESGRGFFIEWQNGQADIAGYMYDDSGNPVWYIAVYPTPDAQRFEGNWWQYANGQSMFSGVKPATRVNDHVAPVTITFQGSQNAIMTLPNGRTTALTRQPF